jgi:RNA-directed DNA polymerase
MSIWCLFAREQAEPLKLRMQMTADKAGALKDDADKWRYIDWKETERQVRRLQVRIAKAVKENRWDKVKALQYLLTHSFYAKLPAVKRVTGNSGSKTPGVDGGLTRGVRAKWRAARSLRRRGYHPRTLRRIYIETRTASSAPPASQRREDSEIREDKSGC